MVVALHHTAPSEVRLYITRGVWIDEHGYVFYPIPGPAGKTPLAEIYSKAMKKLREAEEAGNRSFSLRVRRHVKAFERRYRDEIAIEVLGGGPSW